MSKYSNKISAIEKILNPPKAIKNVSYTDGVLYLGKKKYQVPKKSKLNILLNDTTNRYIYTMGPRGSGKSVANLIKSILVSLALPICTDGKRHARWLIARSTHSELLSTSYATLKMWLGFKCFNFTRRGQPYLSANVVLVDDVGEVNIEYLFLSFDHPDTAEKAKSLELTGVIYNECLTIPTKAMDALSDSVSRYPSKEMLGGQEADFKELFDSNAMSKNHELYDRFVINNHPFHVFIHQEGGLIETSIGEFIPNPDADNLENLPKGYYINGSHGKSLEHVRSHMCNKITDYIEGASVFPEFNSEFVKETIKIDQTRPVFLSFDFGGVNACILGQYLDGQVRVIKEFQGERKGLISFLSEDVREYILKNCSGCDVLFCVGDCSNAYSFESAKNALTIVKEILGIATKSSKTNIIVKRIYAVEYFISKQRIGRKALNIAKDGCPLLTEGMLGGYIYQKITTQTGTITSNYPSKNRFSHLVDCLQYACLELKVIDENEHAGSNLFFLNP